MKTAFKLLTIFLFTLMLSCAERESEEYTRINEIFNRFDFQDKPGGAVAVALDGKTIYSRAFGLASMEYGIPNTPSTLFNTGSVSKQFTAMGIVLLDLEGKISIDDDIRKYMPELPEFGDTIRIRHLLHHTSGLRSLHYLFGIAGWRGDDSRTNEDLYRFLERQRDLNFRPGEEYMYCNTGYMLMARIIEIASEETFTDWIKKSVFLPLGMVSTYAEDNYRRIVPGNATSYFIPEEGGFERSIEYWGYTGSGNVHSTVSDLLTWLRNFHAPQEGWENAFENLQILDPLNNGDNNNYAFGIILDDYKGKKRIQHGGSVGGFRAFICAFPEEKLDIVVLANSPDFPVGQISSEIADIFLGTGQEREAGDDRPWEKFDILKLPGETLKNYQGLYWNENESYSRKIYIENDTLKYFRDENSISPLLPISENEFVMAGVTDKLIISFNLDEGKVRNMQVSINDGTPLILNYFEAYLPGAAEKQEYCGEYYSPELMTSYFIDLKNDTLVCYHPRHGYIDLNMQKKDIFNAGWPLNLVKITRNGAGAVTGMAVTNSRVRNLIFDKRNN